MCGIATIIAAEHDKTVDSVLLRKMTESMKHRGPDGEGVFYRPNIGLGHRRLSIIDVDSGKQPMSTQDKRYTIVLNGEIFNYQALRKDLIEKKAVFRTQSDTEVVLQGFKLEGKSFLTKLEGMFAGVLYDQLKHTTYVFRDVFGIKPLFYMKENGFHFFSSEMHMLIEYLPKDRRKIHQPALESYLRLGYVLGKPSLVQGIEKVTAGYILEIDDEGELKEESFSGALMPQDLSEQDSYPVEDILLQAVSQSTVSDVEVGLYLSGGVDSSYLASVLAKEMGQKPKSFSVSYSGDPQFNEAPHAQKVADILGLEHQNVECKQEHFVHMQDFIANLNEPLADPSVIPLTLLSQEASQHVKVVLSGEGGDEIFGGYHRYYWERISESYVQSPKLFQKLVEFVLLNTGSAQLKRRVLKLAQAKEYSRSSRYANLFSRFTPQESAEIFSHVGMQGNYTDQVFASLFAISKNLPPQKQLGWIDLMSFLGDGLLNKADVTSMKNSLEVRVPFLQKDVVHAVFKSKSIPLHEYGKSKVFLRKLLSKYLPREIIERKKQGFELPIKNWMNDGMKDLVQKELSQETVEAYGIFPWPMVENILHEFYAKGMDRSASIYRMLALHMWLKSKNVRL